MSGRFITLEGGEGAGKSTQARLLKAALEARGVPVLQTREPGGAPGAERLRALLLSGEVEWSSLAETLLHFAARAEHVERTIRPALARGITVVCDRFTDSTMAYQGYGQGVDRAMIGALTRAIGLVPDLTMVLDVEPMIAAARLQGRGGDPDRYERLGADFHARVRAGFRSIAAAETQRCVVVDAGGSGQQVHRAVLAAVADRLGVL